MENLPTSSMRGTMTSQTMHVSGMMKHTRHILAKGAIFTPLSPKMMKIPLMMTLFHKRTHGNPPSKALTHQAMSSTMSTQPYHTFLGLLDIKITHLTPQITPLTPC